MSFTLLSGTANQGLAESTARTLGLTLEKPKLQHFPDGELSVEVEGAVRGKEVHVIQPTSPPVADNLLELLFTVDALHRAGANKIVACIPYFGYARQDRRVTGLESIGARIIANLLGSTALSRVVVVDIHNPSLEGFFSIPLENVSAVSMLAKAAGRSSAEIVVSPDLGAAKLAERYAALLDLPVAIVHKKRITEKEVKVYGVAGDVRNKRPLIVDDMISTAGTIEAAAKAVLEAGCLPEITVAATHGLLVGPAIDRLAGIPLKRLLLTNTVSRKSETGLPIEEIDVGPLLAEVVGRLHNNRPITDLLFRL